MVYPCSTMQSVKDSEVGDLEAQLACKEKEWKELQAARVHQLESSLRKAQEECSTLRERYQRIKEGFQFNLAILEERDKELEKYDVVATRALTLEKNRQEEVKRLRLQVSWLEEQRRREAGQWKDELSKSEQSAAQYRLQMDEIKLSMAGEVQKQTEEYERMKLNLQNKIREVEGELTLQRQVEKTAAVLSKSDVNEDAADVQEMTVVFNSELRQREHGFNVKMDEMRAVVLSHDLKVKLLSKEVEVHSQTQLQTTEALKSTQDFCQQIQTQLQHKEQEIRDVTAAKDSRIKELEEELKLMKTKCKKEDDDHMRKYNDVIRALRKYETQLQAQRQAYTEQLQTAEKRIIKLQEDGKIQASKLISAQRDQQEEMKHRDETIHRLRTEVDRIKNGWDEYVSQVSSEVVVKDTEMIALKERETKLRSELERSREEIEGYKQQLSAGLRREQLLEQKRVQVELEWQRRCEDVKAELYLANEQLIQDLTWARDQVKAELKEKEQELQDLSILLRSVKTERDQALQGLTPQVDYLASEEIRRLQEQNGILRSVVNQMRKDMEGLSHLPLHPQTQTQPQSSPPQTVKPPEAPSTHSDPQTTTGPPPQSTETSIKVSPADYTDALEQEVSQLKAQCRKLKEQLEGATGPLSASPFAHKPSEDLIPADNTIMGQQGLEQGGGCQEKCANTSSLRKQEFRVSHREPALTSITEQGVTNAALVRQLQEENLRLCRQQQQTLALMSGGVFDKIDSSQLHTRLKQAALCISRLSVEKQQLIKMGNRLRAQITAAGLQEAAEPQRDLSTETRGDQQDRLSALEGLQYQLTTQELQYALRQIVSTPAEQPRPENNSRDPATKGAANPWTQGHKTPERPEPCSAVPSSLLSSEESLRSLKELWDKLDQGLSPSIFSEGELSRTEVAESGAAGVQMMMQGVSAPLHNHPPAEGKQRRNPPTASSSNINKTRERPGGPGGISKIRNYSIKD
ncbi:coiled-coil domain-containing protein 57 isoform X2 [Cheilinus undulatus]|uniref:coiled-coil domain-containing protein 57 isoform X2 n=1 Tax=Cheilinus undulatus TaxID=241271 RepID=UPI001BD1F482|nr:coiled-coil domain-containing protein 57 isoform X2 [Cheilinus undulatus]